MYATPTGLAPERVSFHENDHFRCTQCHYQLRPELIESLYVLNALEPNILYQDMGWKIFSAVEENCRNEVGYGSYLDVRHPYNPRMNRYGPVRSWFYAETLKYAFLLQDGAKIDILNEYVFNTEGHPLRMFDHL